MMTWALDRSSSTPLTFNCATLLPGDLVTSLRETGEKILLPYPIWQPARSRLFAFALPERMLMLFRITFVTLYHDWNSELCFN